MADSDRYVIDTNVIVNMLTGGGTDCPAWFERSVALWRAAEAGEFQACLSVVTVAEVLASPQVRGRHLDRRLRRRRSREAREWLSTAPYMPIEADDVLAREAGAFAQEFQLKGADALILASAVRVRAPFLFTWDDGLLKVGAQVGGLIVCSPDSAAYEHQPSLNV